MGTEALYHRPSSTKPEPRHKIYPYLLRSMVITRPNQVWAMDVTYIRWRVASCISLSLLDWATRRVLARRLSITMESAFYVEILENALERHGRPEIFKHRPGFAGATFTGVLASNGVGTSMDGKRA